MPDKETQIETIDQELKESTFNLVLLCIAKTIRTIGFGAFSIVLALFLLQRGFTTAEVGLLLSATLLEDALVTTLASTYARIVGVRTILFCSCALIVVGGIVLATAEAKWLLALAVVCGIVSPAGYEGGPFAPLEQTIIAQIKDTSKLTKAFSWYNMVGFAGAALGALFAGACVANMRGLPPMQVYQVIIGSYALGGVLLALLYSRVKIKEFPKPAHIENRDAELEHKNDKQTLKHIFGLAALQSVDALGGGFVVQSLLTLWFYERYHVDAAFLGPVYFWCNIIAALSFVGAPYIVRRLGLLNTMVFTHLPCSLALCLLPFLPSASFAAGLLLLRSGFSSMDIPVRQAYTMVLVPEHRRSMAAGVTTSARAIAQGLAPGAAGLLTAGVISATPLILAGVFKSIYDIALFFCFRNVPINESAKPVVTADGAEGDKVVANAC